MPYLIAVARQGRERACRKDIRAEGLRCWHPIERRITVVRGRKISSDHLLLGPYLFVEHPNTDAWKRLARIKDCAGVIMRTNARGTEPAIATDEEVQRFRDMEDADGFIRGPKAKAQFTRGDAVRIIMGAFTGFKGSYVSSNPRGDAVEIDYFGRKTRIGLQPGALEAV